MVVLAAVAKASTAALPNKYADGNLGTAVSSLTQLLQGDLAMDGPFAPITNQIVRDYVEPIQVNRSNTVILPIAADFKQEQLLRNSYVVRDGTELRLGGKHWTASGGNVYWLGLDQNVIPTPGQPFYAPYNASYPTKGRVVEIMNTLVTMGAHTIRSQTLGISVGNPLSLEPDLNVWNDEAFEAIDWAVYQAREHGLRIFAPLIDNYDY